MKKIIRILTVMYLHAMLLLSFAQANKSDFSNIAKEMTGVKGGKIIAEGKPEEICKINESYTGNFLKPLLNK